MPKTLRLGIVGYSAQPFDHGQARALLAECLGTVLQLYPGRPIEIVSGLTNQGIPALAYELAASRGFRTVGFACQKAINYPCYPCDKRHLVGSNWGDESARFIGYCDVLIRIGGGAQSARETAMARELGKVVIERDLAVIEAIAR